MQSISGTTRLAGVIGNPLTHTLSPAMHNAVYEHLGLDWVYIPLEVRDEIGLRRLAAVSCSLPLVGFNVTMPYKRAALELCDEVAMAAQMAGAVNTIHCKDGKLVGYNTDGRGLLEALEMEAGFTPAGTHAVIVGAGGAAGAAAVALILGKAARVTVVNRSIDSAEELVGRLSSHAGATVLEASGSEQESRVAFESANLIVNATSVGMHPDDASPVPGGIVGPGQVVYDMVYGTHEPTALLEQSRRAGAVALDGLGMLVCQGATSVDIWHTSAQTRTPRDVMRAAAEEALRRRRETGQGTS
jgi:shikimate dehydrogenase